MLGATLASAGVPSSTSTTTTASASSTTSTLLGACADEATYESILCRIDALIAEVEAATDLGRFKDTVLATARKARRQASKAAVARTGRRGSNRLKKAANSLDTFRDKLYSDKAKDSIPRLTSLRLIAHSIWIRHDADKLRRSL